MLNRKRILLPVLVAVILGGNAVQADDLGEPLGGMLAGRVTSESAPLPASKVYAYQLSDLSLRKVETHTDGSFLFERLPAGLYKIIAYKAGFVPGVALLTRAANDARQFLDLQLVEQKAAQAQTGKSFWSVREQIPPDVLRDMAIAEADRVASNLQSELADRSWFQASMEAVAGMDQDPGFGETQRTGGRIGIEGGLRDLTIGVSGNFVDLQPTTDTRVDSSSMSGSTQMVSVSLDDPTTGDVRVTTLNNQMVTYPEDGQRSVVDFERHRVTWSRSYGVDSRSDFAAQYTDENNFYSRGPIEPMAVPQASRTWGLEGSYSTSLTERSTVQAGFRYRERQSLYDRGDFSNDLPRPSERVDLFGTSGFQLKPKVLVEVGMHSTVRDGNMSLAPSGGFVLQLGPNWRAYTSASVRAHERRVSEVPQDFTPVFFGEREGCEHTDEMCYRVLLARTADSGEEISFGAVHRQYADTLRLYFSEDFFDHLESLYLVRGDSLPELQFAMTRRITPKVFSRLASNLAAGGGGVLYTVDETPYENEIRYLVTSLDTQFEQTATGVFLAFHHLAQKLSPFSNRSASAIDSPKMELDRLQLTLTQDLGFLERLASDFAIRLNMEVSRGSTPEGSPYEDEDLRKRIMGALAVTF